ncbi:MAG TPA: hypothetical protein VFI46_03540 [Jiangellaceae bacterium]|nr:hypothetical protein [Jiangellaceae bacterium]
MRSPLLILAAVLLVAGCGDGGPDGADALATYTDPGDGCHQVVSAIGYADDLLLVLGQEDHQKFEPAVRSRLAAVEGTISLEVEDFPNRRILLQALRVADLADRAQASEEPDDDQIAALRQYRREAAQLVIDCAAANR